MTDHADKLREAFETYETQTPDPVAVYSRVQELSRNGRELLMAASVMGSEFDLDVVAEVVDLDERAFLDALDEVRDAALVSSVGRVRGARHRFAHGLVRDVVYDDLSDARRQRLHRRAGEVLRTTPSPPATEKAR